MKKAEAARHLILSNTQSEPSRQTQRLKNMCRRAFDIAGGAVAVSILAPFAIAVSPAIAWETRQFPLFVQKRVGQNGKAFPIFKLRSYKKDGTIGPIGRFVRKTKLDEAPQTLLNILIKGDMSLVGPRPHVAEDDIAHDPLRQSIKPGLTGFGKIIGGNHCSHDEELLADHVYIEACNKATLRQFMIINTLIVAQTPMAIIRQRRAPISYDQSGHSTALHKTLARRL